MSGKWRWIFFFLFCLPVLLQAEGHESIDKKDPHKSETDRIIMLPPIVLPSIESGFQNDKDPIFSYSIVCQAKVLKPENSLKIKDEMPFFMDKIFSYFYAAMPVLAYADYVPSEAYIQSKLNEIIKKAYGTEAPQFELKLVTFIRLLPNYLPKAERRKLRRDDKGKGWQTSVGQTSKTKPSKAGST